MLDLIIGLVSTLYTFIFSFYPIKRYATFNKYKTQHKKSTERTNLSSHQIDLHFIKKIEKKKLRADTQKDKHAEELNIKKN